MINYENIKPATRVVLNSGILYAKMFISVVIVFFSTRLVLSALGADDFGLYNLVAGIVAMLSFLKSAMAGSTQRFLSFYQGKNNAELQKKVFVNSVYLHIAIGFVLVLLLEATGLFLFEIDGLLKIDPLKVTEAKTIYHFLSATMFFTILAVPFSGTMNSHENLFGIAVIELVEVVMRLVIALSLFFLVKNGKLVYYGLLTASITVVSCLIYAIYCRRKYQECSSLSDKKMLDWVMIKELGSFAGWNLFGSFCSVGKTQGIAIILNHFIGTIANAAYGITNQVVGQLNYFTSTMFRAFNPQIMKSEGSLKHDKMVHLTMVGCKFGFFLLAFISIPCLFELESLLSVWLNNVPEHTAMFCTLVIIATLVTQLTAGLQSAIMATGKIKSFMVIVSITKLLTLPTAFLLLNYSLPLIYVFIGYIFFEAIAGIITLFQSKHIFSLRFIHFFKRVIFKEIVPVISTIFICYFITHFLDFKFRWVLTVPCGMLTFTVSAYFFGLCKDEKEIINSFLKNILKLKP